MNPLPRTVSLFSLALWWGSLTTIGFIVVPMLFAHLDTAQAAGRMAARLFEVQTSVSLVCAAVLLALTLRWARTGQHAGQAAQARTALWLILLVLLAACLASLSQWVVSPHIVARDNLKLWHALGSACYLGQWLCVTALLALRGWKAAI
jgi:cytochrome bd-type quinol oxidase subunit 2